MTQSLSTHTPPKTRGLRLPFSVKLEPRLQTPKWLPWATTIGSVAIALFVTG